MKIYFFYLIEAERVCQIQNLRYLDAAHSSLTVHPIQHHDDSSIKHPRTARQLYEGEKTAQDTTGDSDPSCSVVIEGLPDDVSEDGLMMFLEDKRITGGVEVKEINMKQGKANVTFATALGMTNVYAIHI